MLSEAQGSAPLAVPRVLSKSGYAAFKGWVPSYVTKLIKTEKIKPPALTPEGKIDRVIADAQLAVQRDPAADLTPEEPASGSYSDARTALATVQAQRATFELEALQGKYILAAEVERERFTAGRVMRDEMLAVPTHAAEELAALSDPREVRSRLSEIIKDALKRAADRVRTGDDSAD